MKTVFVGADHAGFALKEKLKTSLKKQKYRVIDTGNVVFDANDDYPDFGIKLAKKAVLTKAPGILVCGSSFGVCIVANKVKGARAVSVSTIADAKIARQHNDANILCLSGWNMKPALASSLVKAFLHTPFSRQARHARRIQKITAYEKKS